MITSSCREPDAATVDSAESRHHSVWTRFHFFCGSSCLNFASGRSCNLASFICPNAKIHRDPVVPRCQLCYSLEIPLTYQPADVAMTAWKALSVAHINRRTWDGHQTEFGYLRCCLRLSFRLFRYGLSSCFGRKAMAGTCGCGYWTEEGGGAAAQRCARVGKL